MSYRNSVGARLTISFAGVILVFAAAVALSIDRLAAFDASVNQITTTELAKVEMTDGWLDALSESMRHTRNMLIMDDKAQIQGEMVKVEALSDKGEQYAQGMKAAVASAQGKILLQAALDARDTLRPLDEEFNRQIQSGDIKAAKDTLLQRSRPGQLALIAALHKMSEYEKANIHAKADELAASYRRARTLLITLSLAAVAIACLLAFLITRALRNPLKHAVAVLGEIGKGNYTSKVNVTSRDEIGQTLQGIERMQMALRERTDREHAAAMENARIRIALDRVSAGTMLGDTEGKIIYVNDALQALFRHQAAEIRKQLPSFDPERIVGGSFEMFPQLAAMTAAHTMDLKMGAASLRIVASPVEDNGRRVGTVVQWVDRTPEVATEDEVQAIVVKAIEGDLTFRIREEGKEAFFKTLASGVNRLLENTADMVRSMARAAAEVRSGSEEISRGNADLSQRTEEQASSLEETASSMEEMTSTVRNNADNAAQANQLASAAREQAERGGSVVGAAVAAMAEINAASKRIADIISVIDEIAFQTNLLALNAAVEAARAGEQGRGFAVVASEVRNLASRSAAAAKEIKTLIKDSVGKVADGTKLVDESGKALAEIVVRVKKVTDVMAEIANSSREQASGIEQVNKAITTMDDVTQQNAALVEEASAAAQALTEQASSLTQLIARYRVGEGAQTGEGATQDVPHATARPATAAAAPRRVERRAPNRPMTGKKRPVAASIIAVPVRAAAGDDEQWKDF
jgi:methyl-accepting chemotaxis protein